MIEYGAPLTVHIPGSFVDSILKEVSRETERGATEWTTERHDYYPTHDVPLTGDVFPASTMIADEILDRFKPEYARHFPGVDPERLVLKDAFVAKYSADAQASLEKHEDGTALSFVCVLNDDFEGGGTRFDELDAVFRPAKAECILFAGGSQPHEGLPTLKGTRYILAGFVGHGLDRADCRQVFL